MNKKKKVACSLPRFSSSSHPWLHHINIACPPTQIDSRVCGEAHERRNHEIRNEMTQPQGTNAPGSRASDDEEPTDSD